MVGRAFSVAVDFDLHAVTCPGVWLCPNGKVALQINIFDSCVATHRLTPIFPLLYHNKFTFKKIFNGVTTLAELEKKLTEEYIFAELIQWSPNANKNISLATFETNLVDLLYPAPCFKGLLAGVDVDLLMEPTKFFPGILSPIIEVSTRTTIEEVTDFSTHPIEAKVINPKLINSMNQRCVPRKKETSPSRRFMRQKRVCHTNQGKLNPYICRLCRRQQNSIEVHNSKPLDHCLTSSKNQCYLSVPQRRQICSCSSASPKKNRERYSIHNDAHILDSCPICLKYKCYFSTKTDSDDFSKFHDTVSYQNPYNKCAESKTKLFNGINCNNSHDAYKHNMSKLSSTMQSLNLQNDTHSSHNCKICNDNNYFKRSLLRRQKSGPICRSNSAPSLKDDPATSILLAKMRQLEKTKEKLNYAKCPDESSNCTLPGDDQNNDIRKGFYKNLEKFYKRMYKHAKKRALDLNEI